MKLPKNRKNRDTMKVSKVFKKIDEHMKAYRENEITMSPNKKLEKEIISNRGV
jgi:hypothetical protein